jgi:hypothetical protein
VPVSGASAKNLFQKKQIVKFMKRREENGGAGSVKPHAAKYYTL